jgi:hypothetical protein
MAAAISFAEALDSKYDTGPSGAWLFLDLGATPAPASFQAFVNKPGECSPREVADLVGYLRRQQRRQEASYMKGGDMARFRAEEWA